MMVFRVIVLIITPLIIISCSNIITENSNTTSPEEPVTTKAKNESDAITGFDSIETLAASALGAIKSNDYKSYYSHVMTKDMEIKMAKMIKDSTVHDEFIKEYGFSLKEEKEYFDYLIKYFSDKEIDLNKAKLEGLEYTEYKGGEYEPVILYEVFIPIEMKNYETLIDFTVIEVEGKYYLTSELGF